MNTTEPTRTYPKFEAILGRKISEDEAQVIDQARLWTPLEEDLGDLAATNPTVARQILELRLGFATGDAPRTKYWQLPEGIEKYADLPLAPASSLTCDLYIPEEASIRGGAAMPIFVDIHGGGFVYGNKTLNGHFCAHLATRGFGVFSLDYTPATGANLNQMLREIAQGLAWVKANAKRWHLDADRIFITGDSAGGTLAYYTLLVHTSTKAARSLNVNPAEVHIRGAALVSGLFDLRPYLPLEDQAQPGENDPLATMKNLGVTLFKDLCEYAETWVNPRYVARNVAFPPLYLCTSSDDFLETDTLALATDLARAARTFQVEDWVPPKGQALGHVFPVGYPQLGQGAQVLDHIRDFAYQLL